MYEIIKDVLAVVGLGFIILTIDANTTNFLKLEWLHGPDF